jgi:predicted component of type VI protein secretion system
MEQEGENRRELLDRLQKRHDASADLRECKASLERGVIEIALRNAETMLRREREQEEPLHQFAQALANKVRRGRAAEAGQ